MQTVEQIAIENGLSLVSCKPMRATIPIRQCKINQERAVEFWWYGSDYFSANRLNLTGKYRRRRRRYKSKNWGNVGDGKWVDPYTKRCFGCELFNEKEFF